MCGFQRAFICTVFGYLPRDHAEFASNCLLTQPEGGPTSELNAKCAMYYWLLRALALLFRACRSVAAGGRARAWGITVWNFCRREAVGGRIAVDGYCYYQQN